MSRELPDPVDTRVTISLPADHGDPSWLSEAEHLLSEYVDAHHLDTSLPALSAFNSAIQHMRLGRKYAEATR